MALPDVGLSEEDVYRVGAQIPLRRPPHPGSDRHHLHEFFTWCARYDHISELVNLARTIDRWRDPIITAIQLGVSNAKSEGPQPGHQLEGRKAYGFRNTTNQRRRLRNATTAPPGDHPR